MIAEAQRNGEGLNITFQVCAAESLGEAEAFDVIFCNSAFQWFRDPQHVLNNCYRALRSGGRLGIQAPARVNYCPNFIQAADTLLADPRTRTAFLQFHLPWFFLETSDDYAQLCKASGFLVNSCWVEKVTESCSPDKAFEMFESGAAAGYLNPDCYDTALPLGFIETARQLIALAFRAQADLEGIVSLTFSRFYLLAYKP
jgi:trans-aconitate methyltransferase